MSEKSVLFRLLFYTDPDPALFCTLPQILNNFFTTAKNCQQLKLADWKEQYLLSTWTGSNPDPKHSVFQTISNRRLLLNSGKGGSQADIEKLAEPLFAQTQPRVVSLFSSSSSCTLQETVPEDSEQCCGAGGAEIIWGPGAGAEN